MKRVLSILFLVFALIFVTSISCEEEKPCVTNNTCTVKVVNNTSYFLHVDVTYYDDVDNYNDERQLGFDQSTVYTMHPDHMIVWAANSVNYQNDIWDYSDIYVDQCEDYKFTWRSSKKGELTLTITDGDSKVYNEEKGVNKKLSQ